MTEASLRALDGMRDLSMLQWYVIPLLAFVFYVYVTEIAEARRTGRWEAITAGLTLFGMDFVNESVNGWIFVLSGRSALWTVPGPTALRTMIGWNIEIMFMFALSGVVYWKTLSPNLDRRVFVLEKWAVAAGYSVFCVFIELFLNKGGLLVWEYSFWNHSFAGVWLIFLFGYFHFYVAVILVNALSSLRARAVAIGAIYGVAVLLEVIGLGILGWKY